MNTHKHDNGIAAEAKVSTRKTTGYVLIPTDPIKELAHRFELGVVNYPNAWNALASPETYVDGCTNRDFLLERVNHVIEHALAFKEKVLSGFVFDCDNDGSAIMWAGALFSECRRHWLRQQELFHLMNMHPPVDKEFDVPPIAPTPVARDSDDAAIRLANAAEELGVPIFDPYKAVQQNNDVSASFLRKDGKPSLYVTKEGSIALVERYEASRECYLGRVYLGIRHIDNSYVIILRRIDTASFIAVTWDDSGNCRYDNKYDLEKILKEPAYDNGTT